MIWDHVLDRLNAAGLAPVEETYMEHYGKFLAVERPEFRDRHIRCTYGRILCQGMHVEILLFPSDGQLQDALDLIGPDPWWIPRGNVLLHFPECDPAVVDRIVKSLE